MGFNNTFSSKREELFFVRAEICCFDKHQMSEKQMKKSICERLMIIGELYQLSVCLLMFFL